MSRYHVSGSEGLYEKDSGEQVLANKLGIAASEEEQNPVYLGYPCRRINGLRADETLGQRSSKKGLNRKT